MEQELRRMFEMKETEMTVPPTLSPELRNRIGRKRTVMGGLVAAAAVALVIGGFAGARSLSNDEALPPADPDSKESPFVDTWVSTDIDGSAQTMVVRASGEGAYEIVVRDDSAGVCSGATSTMTGTGRLDGAGELVIPAPAYTCDDGSEPKAESGPPLEEQLRNLTFAHDPDSDTLTDNLGLVWQRKGREIPQATLSGGMWPQSNLEEVREAQRLADEGDSRYTWQVFRDWPPYPEMEPAEADIFVRFVQEELGWEEFSWGVGPGLYPPEDWPWQFVVVRCAAGGTNPMYSNDPDGGECAPTIDDHRYETVRISADMPVRVDDPSGIWVVKSWTTLQPSAASVTSIDDFHRHQIQQVEPPSNAEATEFLSTFLQARVDGEGAEEYLRAPAVGEIPLMYATTADAPYERFEFELVQGPAWPSGWMEFEVRLFAEGGGTVVEQPFLVDRDDDGRLVLVYRSLEDVDVQTIENGDPVAELFEFIDGEVTLYATDRWEESFFYWGLGLDGDFEMRLELAGNPRPVETGCRPGPAPADAEALARSIGSDSDLATTAPVPVTVGGVDAVRMDVTASPGAKSCAEHQVEEVLTGNDQYWSGLAPKQGSRTRLYLLDLPEGFSAQILAIAVAAPEDRFETLLKAAEPVVDSIELNAP